jgi:hypothetical protein
MQEMNHVSQTESFVENMQLAKLFAAANDHFPKDFSETIILYIESSIILDFNLVKCFCSSSSIETYLQKRLSFCRAKMSQDQYITSDTNNKSTDGFP